MKHKAKKAKIVAITGISFMLLSVMQAASASTEVVGKTVFELTNSNMDVVTAGVKTSAGSYAVAQGSLTNTQANASTNANVYTNYGVSSAVAVYCCKNGSGSTEANASASGDVVRSLSGNQNGPGYSASWAVAVGH